jgi:demethylmenaquinone methyltransferase/2-methoxy-6-polyprenyl-1,4-benzoquinol methylase
MKNQASTEVKPYNPSESKKEQVTSMFDKIAPYYDYLNRFLSLGIDIIWRKKAIKVLSKFDNKLILDIATGTGDLAIEAVNKLNVDKVIGLDISEGMLEIGRKKISKKKLSSKIEMVVGDSEALQFNDNHFNTVMAAFGVRNFENLEKGLGEMFRVTKPGGQMMILEFSKPKTFPIKNIFNAYFKYLLPVIGKLKSKDPKAYKYLYESVQAFPDYDNFALILKNIGFTDVTYKPLTFGICTIYLAKK